MNVTCLSRPGEDSLHHIATLRELSTLCSVSHDQMALPVSSYISVGKKTNPIHEISSRSFGLCLVWLTSLSAGRLCKSVQSTFSLPAAGPVWYLRCLPGYNQTI